MIEDQCEVRFWGGSERRISAGDSPGYAIPSQFLEPVGNDRPDFRRVLPDFVGQAGANVE